MFIKCFAKVNLFLNITKKRTDGFHDLDSLFQNITLFDIIKLNKADEYSLQIDPLGTFSNVTPAKDNILDRIYNYFSKRFCISPVSIVLQKNIPLGAGLGGGSSDGAGLILALNELFALKLSYAELIKIADSFGSDIPFFLQGGTARIEGKGEIISPVPFQKKLHYVLVYPEIHISTAEAYQENVILNNILKIDPFLESFLNKDLKTMQSTTINSFEELSLCKYATLHELSAKLKTFSEYTLLSGSGSSMFALFNNKNNAKKCYNIVREEFKYCYLLTNCHNGIEIQLT